VLLSVQETETLHRPCWDREILMKEEHFSEFWHSTLEPETPAEIVTHWRDYEFSGITRGRTIVDIIRRHVDLVDVLVLDVGCGYGGSSIAFAVR
jgi:2-polyprenyl-3-methyl-5-hydroxy-6-metoxy-1,4-benzoquinol methylase